MPASPGARPGCWSGCPRGAAGRTRSARAPAERRLAGGTAVRARPLTEALFAQLSGSFPYYPGEETSHLCLWPYLLADPHYFATPDLVADRSFQFPPLAQRLFEAGLCRQGCQQDYYREVTLSLLAQGKSPQVEIRPHLERLARGLLATQPAQRETTVDVLLQGLRDGRATPADIAGALAGQIRATEQGFAQLDQALASLSATGEAGRAVVALALEQAVCGGVAEFSPRKLSLVLDRLAGLLEETRRTVHDPAPSGNWNNWRWPRRNPSPATRRAFWSDDPARPISRPRKLWPWRRWRRNDSTHWEQAGP